MTTRVNAVNFQSMDNIKVNAAATPFTTERRSELMAVKVYPQAKKRFLDLAKKRGMQPAEAQRQAMAQWVLKYKG